MQNCQALRMMVEDGAPVDGAPSSQFLTNVSVCPHCQHNMQVIAELHTPEGIKALLSYDEHARPPP